MLYTETTETCVSPHNPRTIEETGLSSSAVEQLILKTLHFRGDLMGRELSNGIGLKFSILEQILDNLRQQHFIQVKRSHGLGNISAIFALSDAGRNLTRDSLEVNQYHGRAPVPLAQYAASVRAQKRDAGWLTPQALEQAYQGMVVSENILSRIGPAVSSGNSFLIYGDPGNGKTYLAEALFNLSGPDVFVPYAIECQGAIIQVYDPIFHQILEEDAPDSVFLTEPSFDQRWARCKRPFIITGGELTISMLDLSYNAVSKVYDAPFQVKANNGIYLIDDFGRQRVTPAEVLNRWIVPMERRLDYLSFITGGKITVPFETFLIFSTNLDPEKLGDEAFLRRIQYKMLLQSPDEEEFVKIFECFCATRKLTFPEGAAQRLLRTHYWPTGKAMRRCHPRDILSHAINLIHFENRPLELTDALIDRAFSSCFLEQLASRGKPEMANVEVVQ